MSVRRGWWGGLRTRAEGGLLGTTSVPLTRSRATKSPMPRFRSARCQPYFSPCLVLRTSHRPSTGQRPPCTGRRTGCGIIYSYLSEQLRRTATNGRRKFVRARCRGEGEGGSAAGTRSSRATAAPESTRKKQKEAERQQLADIALPYCTGTRSAARNSPHTHDQGTMLFALHCCSTRRKNAPDRGRRNERSTV